MNGERFLGRVLVADGVLSGLCGLGLLVAPGPIGASRSSASATSSAGARLRVSSRRNGASGV